LNASEAGSGGHYRHRRLAAQQAPDGSTDDLLRVLGVDAERARSWPMNREVAPFGVPVGLIEGASGGMAVLAFIRYSRAPRPVQLHRIEPHLHAVTIGTGRNLAIGRKQRQLAVPLAAFIKGVDQLAPRIAQTVTD
jgi:hypothetical protein